MKKYLKVSAIVPAYNEENYIYNNLKTLTESHYIDEVICINDGSTDNTLKQIKKIKSVKLINLKKNYGKAYAISKGIKKSKGDVIVFFDADLSGLNDNHIKKLVYPLLKKKYDGVIGYPCFNKLDKFDKLFKPLTGERAYFKKDIEKHLKKIEKKGYGLELYLNYLFRDKKVKIIPLRGLRHILKHEKQSYDIVIRQYIIEFIDILSEIINQKNPISYLIKSYFNHFFYTKNSNLIKKQLKKLTSYIKNYSLLKFNKK